MPSPRSPNRIGEMRYMNLRNGDNALVAHSGGGQASALQLAAGVNVLGTVAAAGDSVKLPKIIARPEGILSAVECGLFTPVAVTNNGAFAAQVFGTTPDTILGVATATGVVLPVGVTAIFIPNSFTQSSKVGTWLAVGLGGAGIPQVSQFSSIAGGTPLTLTGAQMAGAQDVFITLTAALGGAGTLNSAIATNIIAAIPNVQVGMTYNLRIINASAGAFAWTLTTAAGVTLTGTMSIAQNTFRDFVVTVTAPTTVTIQSVGTGTNS